MWLFYAYPIGPNLVTRPHLVAREVGKWNIYSGQWCTMLFFPPKAEKEMVSGRQLAVPASLGWYFFPYTFYDLMTSWTLSNFFTLQITLSVQIAFLRFCYFLAIYFPMCGNLPGWRVWLVLSSSGGCYILLHWAPNICPNIRAVGDLGANVPVSFQPSQHWLVLFEFIFTGLVDVLFKGVFVFMSFISSQLRLEPGLVYNLHFHK